MTKRDNMFGLLSFNASNSTALSHVDYNTKTRRLYVSMKDHSAIVYDDVPLDVYREFEAADSKGRYFNVFIRGMFVYRYL